MGVRKIFSIVFLLSFFIVSPSSFAHTRIYACVIGSDSAGALVGGSTLGSGLWQSDDSARTWKQLGWKHVKCYSVDVVQKSNGKKIYMACGNGVLRSTDAGITWRMITDWRITEVMDIVIDQKEPKNIYIGTPGAIWKSNDGGDTWYEADSDIPYPIFVSRIKIDPQDHLKVYAATESGVYVTKDGGLEWKLTEPNPGSARDMGIENDGRIETVFYQDSSSPGTRKGQYSDYWCLFRNHGKAYNNVLFLGGPKGGIWKNDDNSGIIPGSSPNIHSMEKIGDELIIGSLSGVMRWDFSDRESTSIWSGLSGQVWRLKTVEIH